MYVAFHLLLLLFISVSRNTRLTTEQLLGSPPYSCAVCDKSFDELSNFRRHVKNHPSGKPFKCIKCGICCGTTTSLNSHALLKHYISTHHVCAICGKHSVSASHLKKHMLVHSDDKAHPCSLCQKRYKTLFTLKEHIRRIHEGVKYKCETCDKYYSAATLLRKHQLTHTGEKPSYKCSTCGKSVTTVEYLKKHKRLHTGEQPHRCKTCGKRFNTPFYLRTHNLIHT